jgi:hypothetical protein
MSSYTITPSDLAVLFAVRQAIEDGGVHDVYYTGPFEFEVCKGTPRHVVMPDSIGFAHVWTPECRLRVTNTIGSEHFIPLSEVYSIQRCHDSWQK